MNLREARIGKKSATLVRPPDRGHVRSLRVSRKIEYVAVPASSQNDDIRKMYVDLAGDKVAGHNTARLPIDHDKIQHLGSGIHGYRASLNLPLEGLVSTKQELLPR